MDCVQFFLILVVYLVLNVCFYLASALDWRAPYIYSISYSSALNFAVNPVIYLSFNTKIQNGLRRWVDSSRPTAVVSTSSAPSGLAMRRIASALLDNRTHDVVDYVDGLEGQTTRVG